MTWLLANHSDMLDAAFALNEGGGVAVKDGKPAWNSLQTAEKVFQSFTLEVKNKGGHSSQPRKDNAIYQLAEALVRLEKLEFPVELNATTRNYFAKMATLEHGQLAADMTAVARGASRSGRGRAAVGLPPYNAQLRTTCVGDAARRRPRRERFAATRARDRQLPARTRRQARRRAGHAGQDDRRRERGDHIARARCRRANRRRSTSSSSPRSSS